VRFNINGVVLLGGLSSSLILCFVWGLAQSGLIAGDSLQGVPKYVELGFWLVVAYAAGIVVWNISIIPHYILKGIDIIIGGNLDAFEDGFKNVKIVDRVSTFAALGIAIMLMANQALLIYPIFITPFKEPRWVVLWAQFALILCYCMIVIRFLGKEGHRDLDKIPAILALGIIAIYCGARYAIGNPDNDGIIVEELRSLFNIHEAFPFRESAEAVFFGMVSSYFWFKLIQLLYPKFLKERKKAAKDKALAELREDYKKIKEDETLSSAERDTAIGANIAIRTYIESISLGSSFTQRILKLLSFVPVLTSVVSLLVTYLNFVHHY
jgi:hypothetical protein